MELLDIYNDNGVPIGKEVVRGDKNIKLNDNEHIAVAIVFIENSKGEFLIQKTSKEKGGYYSSTGGHISNKETPINTIRREIEEELGVNVDNDYIEDLGFVLYDKTIIFLFYMKKDISEFNLQKEEVDYVEYMEINKIKELINNKKMLKSHGDMFKEVLKKRK